MTIPELASFLKFSNWTKNLLIFTPGFFGLQLSDTDILIDTTFCLVSFSLLSSAVYVFNDVIDYDSDIYHPVKKLRPIASGKVPKKLALVISSLLALFSYVIGWVMAENVLLFLLTYSAVNVAYTLWLKSIPVIDLLCIASGFVLRILVGSEIAGVPPSEWLLSLTILMALFLPLVKRKSDSYLARVSRLQPRINVKFYGSLSYEFILPVYAAVIAVTYFMFTFSPAASKLSDSKWLWISAIPVAGALFRFTGIAIQKKAISDPVKIILADRLMLLFCALWICLLIVIYYG